MIRPCQYQTFFIKMILSNLANSLNLTLSKSCNFPFTFNGGLFYSCSNSLPGINNPCALYIAANETILLDIPTFANSTPVTSVNGWIVIQQRIDGSQSFNLSWNEYK
ncbi:hypothetical protein HELRODRAFT_184427, partial [Helobdella robusta]|uniref:Fibrinogen C-terminal domain-containing protein n=1 Tax=Helobdella robusta TaxID=6412 RepID=T1FL66_HELRO